MQLLIPSGVERIGVRAILERHESCWRLYGVGSMAERVRLYAISMPEDAPLVSNGLAKTLEDIGAVALDHGFWLAVWDGGISNVWDTLSAALDPKTSLCVEETTRALLSHRLADRHDICEWLDQRMHLLHPS